MSVKNLIALAPLSMLVACGWVDSTGRDSNKTPVAQISFADGQQTQSSALNELASLKVSVNSTDEDGDVDSLIWQQEPVEQGALEQCNDVPDFDMNIAASSLLEACAAGAVCRVEIDKADPGADTDEFLFKAPKLKAPVGVTFQLTATDNEGGSATQRSTFCLIAINEAPDVNDDSFTVLEGETLTVTAAHVNLLSNDKVHEHVSNSNLQVLRAPVSAPTLASAFSLSDDGGFTYVSARLTDRSLGFVDDTFVYAVTDGSNDNTTGTVSIRVLAKNDPPEQLSLIPMQQAVAGVELVSDLSGFFTDAEGGVLSFAIISGSLPPSGGLVLTPAGLLTGVTRSIDVGNYPIQIIASDGSESITADLTIVVEDNLVVEATSIVAQIAEVGQTIEIDVSDSFSDPESQSLLYSVDTSYSDATLSMDAITGVLTATFDDDGRYTIDVSADDSVTQPTSIRFVVVVTSDNVSPTFSGRVPNQTIELGESITPLFGTFKDSNGDDLEYSVVGEFPAGLTLSAVGRLSGRPTEPGVYKGLRLVATDPFGEFARSNAFNIVVRAAAVVPANSAPKFVAESVFNQGITLGASITPIEPLFTDDDDDVLRYSIIGGTLPLGVVISPSTGLITGTPRRVGWSLNLQVLATDPSGASASSDLFWIRIQ